MSLSPPNSLFSVPSSSLEISEISSATSERIRFSLVIFTYNQEKNIHNIVRILSGLLDAEGALQHPPYVLLQLADLGADLAVASSHE